jgi:hypothetical protein
MEFINILYIEEKEQIKEKKKSTLLETKYEV